MNQLFQLPNLLSISRIFIALVILYYLSKEGAQAVWICAVLMIIAGISDGLDGYLARRMNKVSKLGIMIDPVADKIFAFILAYGLIIYRDFPIWLALVIVGRDLLIIAAGAVLLKGRDLAVPSNLTGKYAFASIALLLGSYVIEYQHGIVFTTYTTVIFIALSTFNYARTFIHTYKNKKPPQFNDRRLYKHLRIVFQISTLVYFFYPMLLSLF